MEGKLLAAILISVCFDTFEGTKSLETPGLNRMLNRHLAVTLVNSIKETKEHFDNNKMWNLEQVFSSTTVREFDSRFTSKMFGYKDVMEYYADCRLYDKLGKIKVGQIADTDKTIIFISLDNYSMSFTFTFRFQHSRLMPRMTPSSLRTASPRPRRRARVTWRS